MSKHFRLWKIDQVQLLPPSVQDFVPKDHLSRFIVALVRESLDLGKIEGAYASALGQPPFDPRMMTALLLNGYASGIYSSRRIAKACAERADFMMIAALDGPDFRTISDFRKRHLKALAGLFVQVLKLAEKAGLVKLGHVALDGTKIKANASKHKAMSYERMKAREAELQAEVDHWLSAAEAADADDDKPHAAVDGEAQIIVAHTLTSSMSDHGQLVPLLDGIQANLGRRPREASADSGYLSEANLASLEARVIKAYIATGRAKHPADVKRKIGGPLTQGMRRKLKRAGWRSRYRLRKQIVEPVFGQIKQARGFRQFLLRGIDAVAAEWAMICTAHNLTKLARPT